MVYLERNDFKKSIFGRSICSKCLRELALFELVPVLSYFFLRGRCRTCKTKIPKRLVLGEILLGGWYLGSFIYFLDVSYGITFFVLTVVLGTLFFIPVMEDLESMEVHARHVYWMLVLSIVVALYKFYISGNIYNLFVPVLIVLPFWLIYFLNKKYIGEADPYIYTSLGLFFGTQFTVSLMLYSVWFGTLYAIIYLGVVYGKFVRNVRIPFLPIIFFTCVFILFSKFHIIRIQDILMVNEFLFEN
jgi:leader peptidase (prepilin peptidase)/N-methyltransferase